MKAEDVYKCQRLAGQVLRYHTWPTLRPQTNAEHSWQVMRVYIHIFGIPKGNAIWHFIQFHDAGEIRWGDLPYPAKSNNPEIKKAFDATEDQTLKEMGVHPFMVTPDERARVKIADLLEMWEFGRQEMAMGNKLAKPICDRTAENIMKLCEEIDKMDNGPLFNKVLYHMKEFTCTME